MQLQQSEHAFKELETEIVIVTFEAALLARAYIDETKVQWPVLIDETRQVYRGYGMLSGTFLNVWGPRTWWAYLTELAAGRLPKWSRADPLQLGGDVLIDPMGIVRFHHVGTGPADRPSVATLLRARAGSS